MNSNLSSLLGGLRGLGSDEIRRNRLGPAMRVASEEPLFDQDYLRALAAGERALREGVVLARELENRGVPCIAYRGPFAGAALYGDVAARPFTDIDLLVPKALRGTALDIAEEAGFERCDPLKPQWFDARHHFHWAIRKRTPPLLCDLHWAVHHPYRPVRIDYQSIFRESGWVEANGLRFRSPRAEHLLLMYLVQMSRETDGHLLKWLDVALLLKSHGASMDWRKLAETANAWRVESELADGLMKVSRLFPVEPPSETLAWARQHRASEPVRAIRAAPDHPGRLPLPVYLWSVFRRFGVSYLFPGRAYFGNGRGPALWVKRAAHFLIASVRLVSGAFDLLACRAIVGVRRRLLAAALCALMTPLVLAGAVPDTNVSLNGAIETDTNQDWFAFNAMPFATYTLSVSTGTIWDGSIELWAPDGSSCLRATNTAWSGSPGQIVWTNPGALAAFRVKVGGLLEFTTGTYALAIVASGYTDSDNDGMPDEWELAHMGSLTNTPGGDFDDDGFNNLNEFYMATLPESAASRLAITDIGPTASASRVTWSASMYGAYQVWSSSNLQDGADWLLRTNVISELSGGKTYLDVDAPLSPGPRFYRVGFYW